MPSIAIPVGTLQTCYMSTLFLLLTVFIQTTHSLTIEPVHIAAEVGHEAVLVCKGDNTGPDQVLVWTFGKCPATNTDMVISTINNGTYRKTNINGKLTVRNGGLDDSGMYCCTLHQKSGTNNSTPVTPLQELGAQLLIYNMPGYDAELITVGAIAGALFLLMIVLIIFKHRREAQQRKINEKLIKIKAQKLELQQSQQGYALKEVEL